MGFNIIPFIFIYSWADMRQPMECEQAIVPLQRRCKGGLCAITASEKCGLPAYHQVHCCGGLGPRLRIFIPLMALSFDSKKGTRCHLCWNECRERNTLCRIRCLLELYYEDECKRLVHFMCSARCEEGCCWVDPPPSICSLTVKHKSVIEVLSISFFS